MLKLFSRLEKGRSAIILFFAALLVVGLVVAGVYNRSGVVTANPFKSTEVMASVRGDEVTVADFSVRKRAREAEFAGYGGRISLAQLGITSERLLDELVNSRIVVQEAERLGFRASREEVRDEILRQAGAGGFDYKTYLENVTRNFGGYERFEQTIRDSVAGGKLRAYVTAGVQVSEQEVRDEYVRDNTQFDVVYVPVTAAELAKRVNPSDEELARYFQEHQTDYRFLEEQKKIRYLFINTNKVAEKIQISDEDLRKEYDERDVEQKQAGVRVQQIVLRVARPELDQEVLNRASELVARIRDQKELTASEEAFADLARGNSEDAATAQKGGWLPNVVRRNPSRKPPAAPGSGNVNDLLQNTLDMKEGQVSDALKTGNAYYIFRRGPSVPKTFEEARPELLVSLRNRRAYGVAQAIAGRAEARFKETKDIQRVAQEFAAEANMSPAEMVKETGFVRPGDNIPDIGSNPQFEEALKPLNEPGQIGERLSIPNGFAIPALVERREPRIPELAEVRDRVAEDFRQARAKEQVEQAARDLASGAAGADALTASAERAGLKAETEEGFRWGRPLGTAGADPALDTAIYNLKAGEVAKTPIKVGDSWYVVGVTKRTDADLAEFGKQQAQLTERALEERRGQVFDEYVLAIRRRLDQEGDIEIRRDVLARLDAEAEPPAALPRAPLNVPVPAGQ